MSGTDLSLSVRLRLNMRIHADWTEGIKIKELAKRYHLSKSRICDRIADHETALVTLGLPIPRRNKQSNDKRHG